MIQRFAIVIAVAFPQWSWYVSVVSLIVMTYMTLRYFTTLDLDSLISNVKNSSRTRTNSPRSTPYTLYSFSIVFPEGSLVEESSVEATNHLLNMIEQALQDAHTARFQVHLHGGLSLCVQNTITDAVVSTYTHFTGRMPTANDMQFIACKADAPTAWPAVCSLVPLFDSMSPDATVVVGSCTGSLPLQDVAVRLSLRPCAQHARGRGVRYVPETTLVAETTPGENEHGIVWRVTASGCVTTANFRLLLSNAGAVTFAEHAEQCLHTNDNTQVEGLADLVLEQYMTDVHMKSSMQVSLLRAYAELEPLAPSSTFAPRASLGAMNWSRIADETVHYTYTLSSDTVAEEPLTYIPMRTPTHPVRQRPLRWRALVKPRRRNCRQ